MDISVNVPQAKFLAMPEHIKQKAFISGFGGGKTYIGCIQMCLDFWRYPLMHQLYAAPTHIQIRDIFFPTIRDVSEAMGLRVEVREANKEVHFYEGRKYRGTTICRSMERPEAIVGFKVGAALIDEIDIMPTIKADHAFNKILARMRWEGAPNRVSVTSTPEGYKFCYTRRCITLGIAQYATVSYQVLTV